MKTVKSLLRKATESKRDPHLALLDFRNTPTQDVDSNPAQRNLGRRARTLLPTTSWLLAPHEMDTAFSKRRQRLTNSRSLWYYNKGAKDLSPLHEGDAVRIKPCTLGQKTWRTGTINKQLDERSYDIETETGILRRNRVYLKKTNERDRQTGNDRDSEDTTETHETTQDDETTQQDDETTTHVDQEHTTARRSERSSRGKPPMRYRDFQMGK